MPNYRMISYSIDDVLNKVHGTGDFDIGIAQAAKHIRDTVSSMNADELKKHVANLQSMGEARGFREQNQVIGYLKEIRDTFAKEHYTPQQREFLERIQNYCAKNGLQR